MTHLTAKLLNCIHILCACMPLLQAEQTATVVIELLDTFGRSTGRTTVLEFVDESGNDYATRFHNASATGIPLGMYQFRVRSEKLGRRGRLYVDRGQVSVVVTGFQSYVDYARGKEPVLRGELLSIPATLGHPIWVKLVPLYGEWSKIVPVHEDHTFAFVAVPEGAYVTIVVSGPIVLKTAPVTIEDPKSFMSIDLAESGRVQVKRGNP